MRTRDKGNGYIRKVMGQNSLIPAQDGEKRRKTIGFETVSSVLMD